MSGNRTSFSMCSALDKITDTMPVKNYYLGQNYAF